MLNKRKRKKSSFREISSVSEEPISKYSERNGIPRKNEVLRNSLNNWTKLLLTRVRPRQALSWATWRRCKPSSEISTGRSCRSRRSGWCRSPEARRARRLSLLIAGFRATWVQSGTTSFATQSWSSQQTAGYLPRQGGSSSTERPTRSRWTSWEVW